MDRLTMSSVPLSVKRDEGPTSRYSTSLGQHVQGGLIFLVTLFAMSFFTLVGATGSISPSRRREDALQPRRTGDAPNLVSTLPPKETFPLNTISETIRASTHFSSDDSYLDLKTDLPEWLTESRRLAVTAETPQNFAMSIEFFEHPTLGKIGVSADFGDNLIIYDASNPANLTPIGTFATSAAAQYALPLGDGTLVAVAIEPGGFEIVDISTQPPSLVGAYTGQSFATHLDTAMINGELHVVLAKRSNGFDIVNVNNPSSPSFVGNYPMPSTGKALQVKVTPDQQSVIVAGEVDGLLKVNITEPTSPTLTHSHDPSEGGVPFTKGIDFARGLLFYIDDLIDQLGVLKLSSFSPVTNTTQSISSPQGIKVRENFATGNIEVAIIDQADGIGQRSFNETDNSFGMPINLDTGSLPRGFTFFDSTIHVANSNEGIFSAVIEYLLSGTASPTPGNYPATIRANGQTSFDHLYSVLGPPFVMPGASFQNHTVEANTLFNRALESGVMGHPNDLLISYLLTTDPRISSTSGGAFSGTLPPGKYPVTGVAFDGKSFSNTPIPPFWITSTHSPVGTAMMRTIPMNETETFNVAGMFFEADGEMLLYDVSGKGGALLPPDLNLAGDTITWTSPPTGVHNFVIGATDPNGARGEADLIYNAKTFPQLGSTLSPCYGLVGKVVVCQIPPGTFVHTDPLTLSATQVNGTVASWFPFNPNFEEWRGTPLPANAGRIVFDVKAADADGAESLHTQQIVDIASSLPDQVVREGKTSFIPIPSTITNPVLVGNNLPSWIVISGSSLAVTPPVGDGGTYEILLFDSTQPNNPGIGYTILTEANIKPDITGPQAPYVSKVGKKTEHPVVTQCQDPNGDTTDVIATIPPNLEKIIAFDPRAQLYIVKPKRRHTGTFDSREVKTFERCDDGELTSSQIEIRHTIAGASKTQHTINTLTKMWPFFLFLITTIGGRIKIYNTYIKMKNILKTRPQELGVNSHISYQGPAKVRKAVLYSKDDTILFCIPVPISLLSNQYLAWMRDDNTIEESTFHHRIHSDDAPTFSTVALPSGYYSMVTYTNGGYIHTYERYKVGEGDGVQMHTRKGSRTALYSDQGPAYL